MNNTDDFEDIEDIEVDLFIEALRRRFGYDFSNYARASLSRRIHNFRAKLTLDTISDLTREVLHRPFQREDLLSYLAVHVSEIFRDPGFYKILREEVLPTLQNRKKILIWVAGCATGEEAFSMAILLYEAGLLDKSMIYATDINPDAIMAAKYGAIDVDKMRDYSRNYFSAGGQDSLSTYFQVRGKYAFLKNAFKENIFFMDHNLDIDGSICEADIVMCRNVLIYFNRRLQAKVLSLLDFSTRLNGYLCLGMKESISNPEVENNYKSVCSNHRIYHKIHAEPPKDMEVSHDS